MRIASVAPTIAAVLFSVQEAFAQAAETPPAQALPAATAAETTARDLSVTLHDLSPWSMFMSADWVVKAIMIGLAFASLVTWTIAAGKFIELALAKRRLARDLAAARDAGALLDASQRVGKRSVVCLFLDAAVLEWRQSSDVDDRSSVKERAASRFSEISRAEAGRIRNGMGIVATIAATSPFVGLFGTVWGIMNSFIGISKSQTTNLAVVAPGIAEALLATAIGLFAAIPAVIIYNHFARATKAYLEKVGQASGVAARHLSRDLDRVESMPLQRAAE